MPYKDPEAKKAADALYRQKNLEKIERQSAEYRARPEIAEIARKRAKEWYEANKVRAAATRRKYREENREQVNARNAQWKRRNPERVRKNERKSRARRIDKIREYRKRYTANNQAKLSQHNAEYYQRTKNKRQAYSREWWSKNLALARMYAHERRAREAAVGGRHAAEDAARVWAHYKFKCTVRGCKRAIEPGGKQFGYCIDHIVPLSRGGTNDLSNLQILCKPHNSQKKNRTNEEWTALFNIALRKIKPMPND